MFGFPVGLLYFFVELAGLFFCLALLGLHNFLFGCRSILLERRWVKLSAGLVGVVCLAFAVF